MLECHLNYCNFYEVIRVYVWLGLRAVRLLALNTFIVTVYQFLYHLPLLHFYYFPNHLLPLTFDHFDH